jgi:hypothetical protein
MRQSTIQILLLLFIKFRLILSTQFNQPSRRNFSLLNRRFNINLTILNRSYSSVDIAVSEFLLIMFGFVIKFISFSLIKIFIYNFLHIVVFLIPIEIYLMFSIHFYRITLPPAYGREISQCLRQTGVLIV